MQLLPRHMQWAIYKCALVLSDVLMTGFAFRLAYFFRFEVPFDFFAQDALISIEHYRTLVVMASFLWILIYLMNGLYSSQNLLGGNTGIRKGISFLDYRIPDYSSLPAFSSRLF